MRMIGERGKADNVKLLIFQKRKQKSLLYYKLVHACFFDAFLSLHQSTHSPTARNFCNIKRAIKNNDSKVLHHHFALWALFILFYFTFEQSL